MRKTNFNTRIEKHETMRPFSSELSSQMDAEHAEYVMDLETYRKMAETTLVKDSLVPYLEVPFSTIFEVETHLTGNRMVTINKGGKNGIQGASNTPAAISALMDGFATKRYSKCFELHQHIRLYDPSAPIERDVRTVFENGRYERYSWVARSWKRSTPFDSRELSRWLPKHRELDLMLMALNRGYEYHIVFFEEWQWSKFQRNVLDRLDLTIAKALEAKSTDAANAKGAEFVRRAGENFQAPMNAVVVDGVDLTQINQDTEVWVTTPYSAVSYPQTVRVGDDAVIRALAACIGQPGFNFKVKKS